jgi:hypothetical protein
LSLNSACTKTGLELHIYGAFAGSAAVFSCVGAPESGAVHGTMLGCAWLQADDFGTETASNSSEDSFNPLILLRRI